MHLSEIGEFGLIRNLKTLCTSKSRNLLLGIGDDAAALRASTKTILLASDMLLEGVHFDLSFTTLYQLGYKALAVNISDIFAMGGKPRFFLMDLGIPRTFNSRDIEEMYAGTIKLAKKFGVSVVGGDTCMSKHGLVLSGTLLGETDKIITRSGAKPGDSIFVKGTLGDSAMGLELLRNIGRKIPFKMQDEKCKMKNAGLKIRNLGLPLHDVFSLARKHLMPELQTLKNRSGITSMIDISDGLLMDLSHICDESGVGAVIYKEEMPISRELLRASKRLGKDPVNYALKGGEDYALLFTSPSKTKKNATWIGEITEKGRYIIDEDGQKRPFKSEGYEHFKKTCR